MSKVLVLRTCNADMTSYNGFKWPESGPYVGLDGIEANAAYKLDEAGKWMKA